MKLKSGLLALVITFSVAVLGLTTASAATANLNLCVAYDLGGPGDRSYNDAVLAGLTKAKKTLNFNFEGFITEGSESDREKRIRAMIGKGCSPILAIGNGYVPVVKRLSLEFPNQQFSLLNDASIASLNVTSLIFADKQVGYLAGSAAARATKSLKVAVLLPSANAKLESGFLLGANAAKKKVKVTFKVSNTTLSDTVKALATDGNDVIFVATTGSDNDIFNAVIKFNESKKKSAPEVGLITIEPDQYLTVTPLTQKYLLGAISKRVDNAILDIVSSAIKDQQISDVLDPALGIYGREYGITGGNIQFDIWSPKLLSFKASLAAASRSAAKL